jgi:hypothetical protein
MTTYKLIAMALVVATAFQLLLDNYSIVSNRATWLYVKSSFMQTDRHQWSSIMIVLDILKPSATVLRRNLLS